MAPAAETTTGTTAIEENPVMPNTMIPKQTFVRPIVLRMAQLSSK